MAFAFWRCCSEFGISPNDLMELPIHMFWSMCQNIDRIRAEKDLRSLNVQLAACVAAQGESSVLKEIRNALTKAVGMTVRVKEKLTSKEDIMKIVRG